MYVAIYVDDNLMIGHPKAIDEVISFVRKNDLVLKIKDNLTNYLSCEIKFSPDMKTGWLGQPHLISNLEKKFGDHVKDMHSYATPGSPNFGIVRPIESDINISQEHQKLYRSGNGMLLYLAKHSRPDIANAV